MSDGTNVPLKTKRLQRIGLYATVVFAAFVIGFLPMWLIARGRLNDVAAAQQSLRLAELENAIAAATIDARRGEYEAARTAASTFYTQLRSELDRDPSAFSPPQRQVADTLLTPRDDVITLLARGDPAAAERLAETYLMYREAVAR